MLIQITNHCTQRCAHCMQDSLPNNRHMEESTFRSALAFGKFLGVKIYLVTGGEPTSHPDFLRFCQILNDHALKTGAIFSVTSNGDWFPDHTDIPLALAKMKAYAGMQVYSNPQWYKRYDYLRFHRQGLESFPNVVFDDEPILMHDLGRARTSPEAQAEVAKNSNSMSCANGHLAFKQIARPSDFGNASVSKGLMCKPMVDWRGRVHLSESCLCPSFGNVEHDLMMDIFLKLKNSKPCLGCQNAQNFIRKTESRIIAAKAILGLI